MCKKFDPYVSASQVKQVYYLQDLIDMTYLNVIKKLSRNWFEVESADANKYELDDQILNDTHSGHAVVEVSDVH